MSEPRLLPGRIVVRRTDEFTQIGSIVLPDNFHDNEREREHAKGLNAQSSHRGRVLAMGSPARTPKGQVEIAPGFGIGDEVIFIYTHNEKGWRDTWIDGKPATWIPQQNVLAIVEHDHERSACS